MWFKDNCSKGNRQGFIIYMNDKIFAQYEKMKGVGKYAEQEQYSYIGTLSKTDPNVYSAFCEKNKYIIRLQMKIENGIITDIKFKHFACTVVVASMSMACEMLLNKPLEFARGLSNSTFVKELEIPEDQLEKNSVMVEETIRAVMAVIERENNG